MQPHLELRRGAQMPEALSGEMFADPFVPIDRWSIAASTGESRPRRLIRGLRVQLFAACCLKREPTLIAVARVDPCADPRHMILGFITES
jgi:hypothetical protein